MDELSGSFRALADPSRRRQLMRLAKGSATSGQLAELLSMSRPAGSQHLAVLVEASLVQTTPPTGRQRWHDLRLERLRSAHAWLGELIEQAESAAALRSSS